MVKINNLEVIQKLVDELKLYPGTDQIPTDLAEKILPCFIINSQEIEMSPTVCNIVREEDCDASVDTVYTVPATGDFFLCSASLNSCVWIATTSNFEVSKMTITPVGDSARILIAHKFAAGIVDHDTNTFQSFPNPIQLEPGSVISIQGNSHTRTTGIITGYTSV